MSYSYFDVPKGTPKADIKAMLDAARPVAYDTFMRRVSFAQLKAAPFFDGRAYARNGHQGRSFKKDRHAEFYRSMFQSRACYYVRHVGKIYIFLADAETPEHSKAFVTPEPMPRPDVKSKRVNLLPRVRVNKRHCWIVRLILKIVRSCFTERYFSEGRYTWLSLAIDRTNAPRTWSNNNSEEWFA
jgi:hypothetical protein